jgi:leucyl aminopeptidase
MRAFMQIKFTKENVIDEYIVLLLTDQLDLPESSADISKVAEIDLKKHIEIQEFLGKKNEALTIVTSSNKIKRIILLGLGKISEISIIDSLSIGKKLCNILKREKISDATLHISQSFIDNDKEHSIIFNILLGSLISDYKFEKYITKKTQDNNQEKNTEISSINIINASSHTTNLAFEKYISIHTGMTLARDLLNEPPNVLNPIEFSSRCENLKKYGLEVEVLDQNEMKSLGMNTLLGVGQGSANEPRLVIMRWNGDNKSKKRLAFVGKGVTFDTGGISLKPANAMIGMKYDMGGAAAVTGLMATLALRKAKVNAVGVIGLVENMPGGKAQRPEDIVKSMSGQTVEILNTDAEGRLVLADALWYTQSVYNPELMINLATLTGAIVVTFDNKYAGLFSNNDDLANKLFEAGMKTGEKLWRLPLDKDFDKMIDSKIADIQNISTKGGAGSITAAQFLQRFVNNVPWAHLDIAGVIKSDEDKATTPAGPTAFGVRLLNQFIEDYYE